MMNFMSPCMASWTAATIAAAAQPALAAEFTRQSKNREEAHQVSTDPAPTEAKAPASHSDKPILPPVSPT